jgi:hypothetical protein
VLLLLRVLCLFLFEGWLLLLEVCYVGEELLSLLRRLPPPTLLVPV